MFKYFALGLLVVSACSKSLFSYEERIEADRYTFMAAIQEGSTELVRVFLDEGLSINFHYKNDYTPLIYAVKQRRKEIVQALIKAGANVNAKDKGGWSALDYANFYNDKELIQLLKEAGADEGDNAKWKLPDDSDIRIALTKDCRTLVELLREASKK